MTGRELVNYIREYQLGDCEIHENSKFLQFVKTKHWGNGQTNSVVLWLSDDYLQDVIYNHEGDLTYSKE